MTYPEDRLRDGEGNRGRGQTSMWSPPLPAISPGDESSDHVFTEADRAGVPSYWNGSSDHGVHVTYGAWVAEETGFMLLERPDIKPVGTVEEQDFYVFAGTLGGTDYPTRGTDSYDYSGPGSIANSYYYYEEPTEESLRASQANFEVTEGQGYTVAMTCSPPAEDPDAEELTFLPPASISNFTIRPWMLPYEAIVGADYIPEGWYRADLAESGVAADDPLTEWNFSVVGANAGNLDTGAYAPALLTASGTAPVLRQDLDLGLPYVEFSADTKFAGLKPYSYHSNIRTLWAVFRPASSTGTLFRLSTDASEDDAEDYYEVSWDEDGFHTSARTLYTPLSGSVQETHSCLYGEAGPALGEVQLVEITLGNVVDINAPTETMKLGASTLSRASEPSGFASRFDLRHLRLGSFEGDLFECCVEGDVGASSKNAIRRYFAERYGVGV